VLHAKVKVNLAKIYRPKTLTFLHQNHLSLALTFTTANHLTLTLTQVKYHWCTFSGQRWSFLQSLSAEWEMSSSLRATK